MCYDLQITSITAVNRYLNKYCWLKIKLNLQFLVYLQESKYEIVFVLDTACHPLVWLVKMKMKFWIFLRKVQKY